MASYQRAIWYNKGTISFLDMQAKIEFYPEIGERFKEAYEYLRSKALVHKQRDLASLIGSHEGSISRMFRGDDRYITSSMVQRISSASGIKFSEDYILRGEGSLLKDGEQDEAPQKPYRAPHEVESVAQGSRSIQTLPIIPIEAQAGIGKGFLYDKDPSQDPEDVYDAFDTMEVVLERAVSDRYKLFRVKGDSMDDDSKRSVCEGDIVLCREVYPEDWQYGLINTKYPNVVVVIEEEGILLKQLTKHVKRNDTIHLHSLNSKYEDFAVNLKDVRAFFYVERIIDRSMSQW